MSPKSCQFFDLHAASWEEKHYPEEVRSRVEELVASFGLASGSRVLDVGAGTGILHPFILLAVGEEGQLASFDLSFEMVRVGMQKRSSLQALSFQADAEQIPLREEHFDSVICFACFPHFSDMNRALSEMARVLKPGGLLYIAHLLSSSELAAHHQGSDEVKHDVLPSPEEMKALCRKANLRPPSIVDKPGLYLLRTEKC